MRCGAVAIRVLVGGFVLAGISPAGPGGAEASTPLELRWTDVTFRSPAPDLPLGARLVSSDWRQTRNPHELTFATFFPQLIAFTLKEVFPDTPDEFEGSSRLPSRLTELMERPRNPFGDHCLELVGRIGRSFRSDSAPSTIAPVDEGELLLEAVSAALLLRETWAALENEIRDRRSGVSLRPKLGRQRIFVGVTFRW